VETPRIAETSVHVFGGREDKECRSIRLAAIQEPPEVCSMPPTRRQPMTRTRVSHVRYRPFIPESHGITVDVVSSGTFELGDQGSPLRSRPGAVAIG
jgi:hypothetical protein